jgi:hypothetical protein
VLLSRYSARIEWVPAESVLTVSDARPEERLTLPTTLDPSRNCTVPDGVPLAAATVALKVTAWPVFEGFNEDVSEVVVVILFVLTDCESTAEVLAE